MGLWFERWKVSLTVKLSQLLVLPLKSMPILKQSQLLVLPLKRTNLEIRKTMNGHWANVFKRIIRHINLLMFDVIDDKPEGVARGVYHV